LTGTRSYRAFDVPDDDDAFEALANTLVPDGVVNLVDVTAEYR